MGALDVQPEGDHLLGRHEALCVRSISGSSPTSTPVRPLSANGSCSPPAPSITSAASTPAPPRPTRSTSNANAASRSAPRSPRSSSATSRSTWSTRRATRTSSPRSNASSAVLDGAVLVVSAVEGVQPQTPLLFRALQRLKVPTLIFVNKIDRAGRRCRAGRRGADSAACRPRSSPMEARRDAGESDGDGRAVRHRRSGPSRRPRPRCSPSTTRRSCGPTWPTRRP